MATLVNFVYGGLEGPYPPVLPDVLPGDLIIVGLKYEASPGFINAVPTDTIGTVYTEDLNSRGSGGSIAFASIAYGYATAVGPTTLNLDIYNQPGFYARFFTYVYRADPGFTLVRDNSSGSGGNDGSNFITAPYAVNPSGIAIQVYAEYSTGIPFCNDPAWLRDFQNNGASWHRVIAPGVTEIDGSGGGSGSYWGTASIAFKEEASGPPVPTRIQGGQSNLTPAVFLQPTTQGSRVIVVRQDRNPNATAVLNPGSIPLTKLGASVDAGGNNTPWFLSIFEAIDVPAGLTSITFSAANNGNESTAHYQEWSGIPNDSVMFDRTERHTNGREQSVTLFTPVENPDPAVLFAAAGYAFESGTFTGITSEAPWVRSSTRGANSFSGAFFYAPLQPAPVSQGMTVNWAPGFGEGGMVAWSYSVPEPILPPTNSGTIPDQVATIGATFLPLNTSDYIDGETSYGSTSGMPPGLALDTSGGSITGTPSGAAQVYSVDVFGINTAGNGPANTFDITYLLALPVWSTIPRHQTTEGTPVNESFAPYCTGSGITYTETGLPNGLTMAANGTVSGTPTVPGTFNPIFTATNSTGAPTTTFEWVIVSNVAPPVWSTIPTQTGKVNTPITALNVAAYQSGGTQPVTYSATGLPNNLTCSSAGSITGTPTVAGSFNPIITATNSAGAPTTSFLWTVNPLTPPTIIQIPTQNVTENVLAAPLDLSDFFVGGTSYGLTGTLPAGMSRAANAIVGTPDNGSRGTYPMVATATNADGTSANNSFNYVVAVQPAAWETIPGQTGQTGTPLSVDFSQYILSGSTPITYGNSGSLPTGLTLAPGTGIVSGTPTVADTFSLRMTADSGGGTGAATSNTFNWVISAGATIPVWGTIPAQDDPTGTAIPTLNVSTYQSGGSPPPTYSATGLPNGLTCSTAGVITGTPTTPGTFNPIITATNSAGAPTTSFQWVIGTPPTVAAIADRADNSGAAGPFFTASLASGTGPATWSATSLPPGVSIDSGTGVVSGTITGTYNIYNSRITATTAYGSDFEDLAWTVNSPPVWTTIDPKVNTIGDSVNINMSLELVGGQSPTTFTSTLLPAGLTLASATGVITGSPTTNEVVQVTITATNVAGADNETFQWTINSGLLPPNLSTLPPSVSGNETLRAQAYDLTSYNTGGAATSWSIVSGAAPGMSISNAGLLSVNWTTNQGTWIVTIRATNAQGSSDSVVQFLIASGDPKLNTQPPTPRYNTVGDSPSISMGVYISGATSWSATGLPPNATINPTSGVITGTLTTANTYNPVVTAVNIHGQVQTTWQWIVEPVPPPGDARYGRTA